MLGEPFEGSELVWHTAELQELTEEDDCCTAVPTGCGYCGDVRRLQASATEVLVLPEAHGGLRSYRPTSTKFCRGVR